MSTELPEVIGLCPWGDHAQDFYVPHGGVCPAEHWDEESGQYVQMQLVEYEWVRRPKIVTREQVEKAARAVWPMMPSPQRHIVLRDMRRAFLAAGFRVEAPCPACEGSGRARQYSLGACPDCKGEGYIVLEPE